MIALNRGETTALNGISEQQRHDGRVSASPPRERQHSARAPAERGSARRGMMTRPRIGYSMVVCGAVHLAVFAASGAAVAQTGGPTPSAPGAAVYFVDIKEGSTLPTKPTLHFGLRNMGVAPAGLARENSGHHHLIIDAPTPPLDKPIPNDFNHLHFGAGQTEAEVSLTPGKHTLQLLLGDKDHIPHNPPVMSERITVNVVEAAPQA